MGVYTGPRLLDVRGALDVLPALPLDDTAKRPEAARATGTDGLRQFAPAFAPSADFSGTPLSFPGKTAGGAMGDGAGAASDETTVFVNEKGPLSSTDNGPSLWALRVSNPRPPGCKFAGSPRRKSPKYLMISSVSLASYV
jgi:hypothetical protein